MKIVIMENERLTFEVSKYKGYLGDVNTDRR